MNGKLDLQTIIAWHGNEDSEKLNICLAWNI